MANETITITQSLDQVTVVSEGPVGLNSGGTISGALSVLGDITVGVDGTGHDVKFFGDTAGKYMQWDQSADKLFINGSLRSMVLPPLSTQLSSRLMTPYLRLAVKKALL